MYMSSISSSPFDKHPECKYMAAGPVSPVVETSTVNKLQLLTCPWGCKWSSQIQNFMSSPQCYCHSDDWCPGDRLTFSYLERTCCQMCCLIHFFLLPVRQVTILMKQLRDSYLLELRRSSPWQCEQKSPKNMSQTQSLPFHHLKQP